MMLVDSRRSSCQRLHARGGRRLAAGPRDARRGRALPRGTGAFRRCHCADVRDWRLSGSNRRDWRSMRFRISAARGLARDTICAIGSGGLIWAWGWMRRRCCARHRMRPILQHARYVLRSTTTDDLAAYLQGSRPPEIAWLSPASQHEEAWFLGLRLNAGIRLAALEQEFGSFDGRAGNQSGAAAG